MDPNDHDIAASPPIEPAWRTLLESKWEALRHQVLGLDSAPRRKLSELVRECESLAAVTAWYESHGNITHAAERLGTSRKAVRKRLVGWRRDNPQLEPSRPRKQARPRKTRALERKSEVSESDATAEDARGNRPCSDGARPVVLAPESLRRAVRPPGLA